MLTGTRDKGQCCSQRCAEEFFSQTPSGAGSWGLKEGKAGLFNEGIYKDSAKSSLEADKLSWRLEKCEAR